jgi:hypothetical protein
VGHPGFSLWAGPGEFPLGQGEEKWKRKKMGRGPSGPGLAWADVASRPCSRTSRFGRPDRRLPSIGHARRRGKKTERAAGTHRQRAAVAGGSWAGRRRLGAVQGSVGHRLHLQQRRLRRLLLRRCPRHLLTVATSGRPGRRKAVR